MKRRSSKSGKNRWADHYTRKARKEKYAARSVYKLQEIQSKNNVIRKGDRVLDLGCAPGSWLQYAAELVGGKGQVVGIDLKEVTENLPPHVKTHTGDLLEADEEMMTLIGRDYHAVLSDMAPSTTGHKETDSARSYILCESALLLAKEVLLPGGVFICKIFQGPDFEAFIKQVREEFSKCKIFKPQSSRKASKEIFVIGLGRKKE
ncbi:MAG: RlmE family RNA methyltransferase [Desulfococcaceae bacterium]|jgi:23S rRNA (uridine2552-2'-O)-methyltransferase|nr:RlmE family RNA methyltransferase [Desulfococcaceae bacterium]